MDKVVPENSQFQWSIIGSDMPSALGLVLRRAGLSNYILIDILTIKQYIGAIRGTHTVFLPPVIARPPQQKTPPCKNICCPLVHLAIISDNIKKNEW